MNHLLTVLNSSDPRSVLEIDLQRLDASQAFSLTPSTVNGVATAVLGPPTAGTFPAGDLWVDSLLALWRCTVAGTPGTWVQERPAVVAAFPSGTIPDAYWVRRSDQLHAGYTYDLSGASWAAQGIPSGGSVRIDSSGNLWIKADDNYYRQLLAVVRDGVPVLTLGSVTQS